MKRSRNVYLRRRPKAKRCSQHNLHPACVASDWGQQELRGAQMKRFASETDLQGCEVSWRLEGDDLARFSGSDGCVRLLFLALAPGNGERAVAGGARNCCTVGSGGRVRRASAGCHASCLCAHSRALRMRACRFHVTVGVGALRQGPRGSAAG